MRPNPRIEQELFHTEESQTAGINFDKVVMMFDDDDKCCVIMMMIIIIMVMLIFILDVDHIEDD